MRRRFQAGLLALLLLGAQPLHAAAGARAPRVRVAFPDADAAGARALCAEVTSRLDGVTFRLLARAGTVRVELRARTPAALAAVVDELARAAGDAGMTPRLVRDGRAEPAAVTSRGPGVDRPGRSRSGAPAAAPPATRGPSDVAVRPAAPDPPPRLQPAAPTAAHRSRAPPA